MLYSYSDSLMYAFNLASHIRFIFRTIFLVIAKAEADYYNSGSVEVTNDFWSGKSTFLRDCQLYSFNSSYENSDNVTDMITTSQLFIYLILHKL